MVRKPTTALTLGFAASVYFIICVALCSGMQLTLGEKEVLTTPGTMCHDNCSGHGRCVSNGSGAKCECDLGWGSEFDITDWRSPSCSRKICPAGKSWAQAAISRGNNIKTAHELRECSNIGLCDYATGICKCPKNFGGEACQRMLCPNDCSGHGRCLSMKVLAKQPSAQPLSAAVAFADKIYGCLCDSSWSVGLTSGTTQQAEWFGPDCSMRRCPTGDDPLTTTVDETDCEGVKVPGLDSQEGAAGNLCHVDCANRGVCDHSTGTCHCFKGFYGLDCTLQSALSQGSFSPTGRINDDRTLGRRSRRREDTMGRGVDDSGQYFNDDL
eukprot:GSChrysophyteH1.ASY1.ANO1.1690.1 assembled CDS